jgi:hypothetical protein
MHTAALFSSVNHYYGWGHQHAALMPFFAVLALCVFGPFSMFWMFSPYMLCVAGHGGTCDAVLAGNRGLACALLLHVGSAWTTIPVFLISGA